MRIPEIRPISDLARDARALVARARERQEPIVITQRGRDVAVLLPSNCSGQWSRTESFGLPARG